MENGTKLREMWGNSPDQEKDHQLDVNPTCSRNSSLCIQDCPRRWDTKRKNRRCFIPWSHPPQPSLLLKSGCRYCQEAHLGHANKGGFKTVKEAFQRNYACMGGGCADIGGHLDDLTDDNSKDFRACTDAASGKAKMTPNWMTVLMFVTMMNIRFY